MPKSLFLLIFILHIYNLCIVAEKVMIQGNNPDYAGQTLHFEVYENQITNNEKTVATVIFDKSGNFKAEFSIDKTE